ncbi:MAG: T9SS type A sorting domain-containing protein [Flavobacteriales bacterium]
MKKLGVIIAFLCGSALSLPAVYYVGTYTGNGAASQAITGVGFQPEVILVKGPTQTAWIATSTMTAGRAKLTTGTSAPATGYIVSIDSDGFTVGSSANSNTNGDVYQFVCWDNADGSIDVGSFTPNNCGTDWANATFYGQGYIVKYGSNGYHCVSGHTSNSGTNRPDLGSGHWTDLGVCSAFDVNISVGYRPEMLWVFGEGQDVYFENSPGQFTLDGSNSSKMSHFNSGTSIDNTDKIISDLSASGFTVRTIAGDGTDNGPANGVKYNWVTWKPSACVETGSYTGDAAASHAVTALRGQFILIKDFNGSQNPWFKTSAMGTNNSSKFTGAMSTTNIKTIDASGFTVGTGGEVNQNAGTFEYIVLCGATTLPVELVYFKGKKQDDGVKLEWQTAAEINASHFVIERSSDGLNYEAIGQLSASGNSNHRINYEFIDQQALSGINYYRLHQYDYDGMNELFNTITVGFGNVSSMQLKVFTDFSGDKAELSFNAKEEKVYTLEIIDQLGSVLDKINISANNGRNIYDVSFSEYSSGFYILRLSSDSGEIEQLKILKK